MNRAIIVALSIFALACNSGEPEAQPEPGAEPTGASEQQPEVPAGPPAGAWVLIDERAGLFGGKEPGAARLTPKSEPGLRLAEVVGAVGERIEVRTIASAREQGCATSRGIDKDFELHLFVAETALKPVLRKPKTVELADGVKLEFAAGVPVQKPGPEGLLAVAGVELSVALASDEVGTWFEPPPRSPPPVGAPAERQLFTDPVLHYGERSLRTVDSDFMWAEAIEEEEGRKLVTFANACGRFTFIAEPGPPDKFDPHMAARAAGILGMLEQEEGVFLASPYGGAFAKAGGDEDVWGEKTVWKVKAGTALTWADGSPAGVTRADVELSSGVEEREGKICYEVSDFDVCIDESKAERSVSDDYGVGGLGLVGTGRGEREGGPGFGGTGKAVPQVRVAKATVDGGLAADIVRRIVRAHINEVRSCYNAGLGKHADLGGRIEISFVVTAQGRVGSSVVGKDELSPGGTEVGRCIAKAVKRWTFPKPTDGQPVAVLFPFELSPG